MSASPRWFQRAPSFVALTPVLLVLACSPRAPAPPVEAPPTNRAAADPGIPPVVADAFRRLDGELTAQDREQIRNTKPEDMIEYHFGLGMRIRNEYGLWRGSPLQRYFLSHGMMHPDHMSALFLEGYRHHLRGERVNMDSLIAIPEDPGKPLEPNPDPPPDSAGAASDSADARS